MNGTMVRPTPAHRLPVMAAMFCFVIVAHLSGQATQNNRILLKPQSRTLLAGNACTVSQLRFTFRTGNDDLRGNGNDLNLEIHLANGSVQFAKNVNQGANWPNNSVHTASIPLEHPTPPDQIKSIRLIHLAQGGCSPAVLPGRNGPIDPAVSAVSGIKTEDNWDMLNGRDSVGGNVVDPSGTGDLVRSLFVLDFSDVSGIQQSRIPHSHHRGNCGEAGWLNAKGERR